MQTEIIHSSPRGMVELIDDKEKYIRRTIYSECLVYDVLKFARSDFIPKIYSVEIADGKTVVCEEYIGGKKLLDIDLTEKQAENVMIQLCSALEDIHKLGIVHRDIKPSNIMIVKDGEIKLIDFEAARFVKEDSEKDTCYLGTEGFAPPEQYGFAQTDFRTDIYAAGQTMKMLLGSFSAKPVYRRIIQRCTLLDPDMRYQSAAELKRALLALRRKPFYFAVGTLLSAATVLALAIGLWPKNSSDHDEFDHIETVTASVQTEYTTVSKLTGNSESETSLTNTITIETETSAELSETVTAGSISEIEKQTGTENETKVETDKNTKMIGMNSEVTTTTEWTFYDPPEYLTGVFSAAEYIPEYNDDDKIFFCDDTDAKVVIANGKKLFKNHETYTMYTDMDNSGINECITIGVDSDDLLNIKIAMPTAVNGVQMDMDLLGGSLQPEFNEYNLDEETIVQLTFFTLDGVNSFAVTIGDKKTYNFTGLFYVKNDIPSLIGRGWGETYAEMNDCILNEYYADGGSNIYGYLGGEFGAIFAYNYATRNEYFLIRH